MMMGKTMARQQAATKAIEQNNKEPHGVAQRLFVEKTRGLVWHFQEE